MEKYRIEIINGVPCILLNERVVYLGNSVDECVALIESGELDEALEMCKVMC